MLSTEERTMLDNIKSLIEELYQMESAEGETEGAEKAEMEDDEEVQKAQEYGMDEEGKEEDKKEAKKAKKAITTASPDASTASSDAEEKIEDVPEEAEEGIKEVAKQLFDLLGSKKEVKKSKPKNDHFIAAIQGLTQVVKSLMNRQEQNDSVINDILHGLGVSKQIEESYGVAKSKKPVLNADTNAVLKEVKKLTKEVDEKKDIYDVRKNLSDSMLGFFRQ